MIAASENPIRAVVIGHPIAHSRSPLIHRFWLSQNNLAGEYMTADVPPETLRDFVASMPNKNIIGGNLTLPHKQLILDIADHVDPIARAIGAANTLWFDNGRAHVTNTDWTGFLDNLDQRLPNWDSNHDHAVLIGAGGAARAVVYALLSRGYKKISVVNRSREKIIRLSEAFGAKIEAASCFNDILPTADIVINTSSLGMTGGPPWPYALDGLRQDAIVHDIVYAPLQTQLLRDAHRRGNRIVDGLGMLLHQAAPGFCRWFGVRPLIDEALRRHVLADLERAA